MREWRVAGGILESPAGVLLVRNERPNGNCDWSPPGGVVDLADHDSVAGLTREVEEETGLVVSEWSALLYEVVATAPDLGWRMTAEVFRAERYAGELRISDPDGIVVAAEFVTPTHLAARLGECLPWVREPLAAFLDERWTTPRRFSYVVRGTDRAQLDVQRADR